MHLTIENFVLKTRQSFMTFVTSLSSSLLIEQSTNDCHWTKTSDCQKLSYQLLWQTRLLSWVILLLWLTLHSASLSGHRCLSILIWILHLCFKSFYYFFSHHSRHQVLQESDNSATSGVSKYYDFLLIESYLFDLNGLYLSFY